MRAFCTIISSSHIAYAITLFQSIRRFDADAKLFVLIVDSEIEKEDFGFKILSLSDLSETYLTKSIQRRYKNSIDELRWSLKSILLIHLLETYKYLQAFFVDSDIYFYSDFKFLYGELGENSFLLSPHWGCMDPRKSELYFQRLMTDGLYNAGFLGATSKGLETLRWWAESCLRACERDKSKGVHDDQAYLNLFPILSPDTKILNHKGCNVAEWNRFEVQRSLGENGNLILDGQFPLVFIHFSNLSYLIEGDPLLVPFLEKYDEDLRRNGYEISLLSSANSFNNRQRLKNLSLFDRLVRRIIGRERFSKKKGWTI